MSSALAAGALAYSFLACGISEPSWFYAACSGMLALDKIARCVGMSLSLLAADNVLMHYVS